MTWNFDKPIKLVRGKGSPETGACWMSAVSIYENENWTDHPKCVCPVIRNLCILLNDLLRSDQDRARVIGPHLFEPVGTATEEAAVVRARADRAIVWALGATAQWELDRWSEPSGISYDHHNKTICVDKTYSEFYKYHNPPNGIRYSAAESLDVVHRVFYQLKRSLSLTPEEGVARIAIEVFGRVFMQSDYGRGAREILGLILDLCKIGRTTPVEVVPDKAARCVPVLCK